VDDVVRNFLVELEIGRFFVPIVDQLDIFFGDLESLRNSLQGLVIVDLPVNLFGDGFPAGSSKIDFAHRQ
jgi:hypothetical protein